MTAGQRRNQKGNQKVNLELEENEATAHENLRDVGKAVLRREVLKVVIKKGERFQISDLSSTFNNQKNEIKLNCKANKE